MSTIRRNRDRTSAIVVVLLMVVQKASPGICVQVAVTECCHQPVTAHGVLCLGGQDRLLLASLFGLCITWRDSLTWCFHYAPMVGPFPISRIDYRMHLIL